MSEMCETNFQFNLSRNLSSFVLLSLGIFLIKSWFAFGH